MDVAGSLCKRKWPRQVMPEFARCSAFRKQTSYFPLHTPSSGRWTPSGLESCDSAFPLARYHGCQCSGWISWHFQAPKILLPIPFLSGQKMDRLFLHAPCAIGCRPPLASPLLKRLHTRIWIGYALVTCRNTLNASVMLKGTSQPYLRGFKKKKSVCLSV